MYMRMQNHEKLSGTGYFLAGGIYKSATSTVMTLELGG